MIVTKPTIRLKKIFALHLWYLYVGLRGMCRWCTCYCMCLFRFLNINRQTELSSDLEQQTLIPGVTTSCSRNGPLAPLLSFPFL